VLRALLVALNLEGVFPGLVRVRRPIAVIRHDRIRDPRSERQLRAVARHLAATPSVPERASTVADWRWSETRSGGGGTGATVVFFRTG